MYEVQSVGPVQNNNDITDPAVVSGHRVCQTRDVKWICLDKIYEKLNRPGFFDIGGTYLEDVADCWFSCRTEVFGNIYLLHIFVVNRSNASFKVSLSSSSRFTIDKKHKIVYLSHYVKEYHLKINQQNSLSNSYLTTYSFSEMDISIFKGKKLFIATKFPQSKEDCVGINSDIVELVKLNHDCGELLADPVGSDFTMESADGVKFPVHRVILAACSEVFKAMLKGETAESQNSCVKLIDVNSEDLKAMLQFVYTGTVTDENPNFSNLLQLADRYNLRGLMELSQCALADQLSMENALENLVLGDMYDSDYLKHAALKYIKQNKELLSSDTFDEVKNAELVRELCVFLAQDDS